MEAYGDEKAIRVENIFLDFLKSFRLDPRMGESHYEAEILAMEANGSSTMFIDFSHVMLYNDILQKAIADEYFSFHTYDYARHFVSACTRILGLEGTPDGVEDHGKLTRVAAFPIGIDSDRFIRALELPQVQDHMKELEERFAGRKDLLGVDRLDMIKGIPQKILIFEKFLEENPDCHDKIPEILPQLLQQQLPWH